MNLRILLIVVLVLIVAIVMVIFFSTPPKESFHLHPRHPHNHLKPSYKKERELRSNESCCGCGDNDELLDLAGGSGNGACAQIIETYVPSADVPEEDCCGRLSSDLSDPYRFRYPIDLPAPDETRAPLNYTFLDQQVDRSSFDTYKFDLQ